MGIIPLKHSGNGTYISVKVCEFLLTDIIYAFRIILRINGYYLHRQNTRRVVVSMEISFDFSDARTVLYYFFRTDFLKLFAFLKKFTSMWYLGCFQDRISVIFVGVRR